MHELVHPYAYPDCQTRPPQLDRLLLIEQEKTTWEEEVLGGKVRIASLPAQITQTVYANLHRCGFSVIMKPGLDIDFSYLYEHTIYEFLTDIAVYYPLWQPLESLTEKEYANPEKKRNLSQWFWERVREGKIPVPSFESSWLAVEIFQKPPCGYSYPHTLAGDRMGYTEVERSSSPFEQVQQAIQAYKEDILADIGLSRNSADIRLPTAAELNLLGNRLQLGRTSMNEWSSTPYHLSNSKTVPLFMGSIEMGGAGGIGWYAPNEARDDIGFRLVIDFQPSVLQK